MQTFLPYESFIESAKSLDYRRLGKQRVEALQVYNVLMGHQKSKGWQNHPAVKMWEGYEAALAMYHNEILSEWISRGYKNNMPFIINKNEIVYPWWLGDKNFHRAMRARLIEKNPTFYTPLFQNDVGFNNGRYFWPDNKTKTFKMI